MRPKGKARGNIHSRLQSLEARIPERPIASEARQRIGDLGRELWVIAEAFRRRRAELTGEG
jgi:hypothetical protein